MLKRLKHSGLYLLVLASSITSIAQPNITKMEYFIDVDPGIGIGVDIPLAAAPNLDIAVNIPTGVLSEGFHLLTIRAEDQNGEWSLYENRIFFVSKSSTLAQNEITKIEYFVDSDPGFGAGTDVPLTAASNLDFLHNIPTGALSGGFHLLTIRAQDQNGGWGLSENKIFFISESSIIQSDITKIEYYIDADPGIGLGVDVPITAAANLDFLESIPTGALMEGFHLLTIRAQDQNGKWSLSDSKPFFVDRTRQIIAYEYALDIDPGVGLATQQPIAPPQSPIDETLLIDTSPLTLGFHDLIIRTQDENLFWSKTSTVTFDVCAGANADFSADIVCEGNPTTFTDLSTNVLIGDIYNWDFDSDGTVDDLTIGSTTFTYPGPGPWTASLVIDRLGCKDSLAITVDVGGIPIPDAGPDQNICVDNTTLSAAPLLVGETGQWMLQSGAGILALASDPTSSVTGLNQGLNEFNWELTDPTGTCIANDIVQINYITVSSIPDAGVDQNVCSSSTVLAGNIPVVGETGTWSVFSGTGSFANTNDPNTTVSLLSSGINEMVWEITDVTGTCTANDMVSLDFVVAVISTAGPDQGICVDNTIMAANTPLVGESAMWIIQSGSGVFADVTDPTSSVSALSIGLNEFIWEVTDATGSCFTGDLVNVNYIVPIADAGADVDVCLDNILLNAGALNVGESGLWTVITGTGLFSDATNPSSNVTGLTLGLNEFQWVVTDPTGTCSSSDNVQIIYDFVSIANAGADQTVCMDNTTLAGVVPLAGESSLWSLQTGTGAITNVNDNSTTVTNLNPGVNEFLWTVTNASANCNTSDVIQVNYINQSPTNAGLDQVVCIDNSQLIADPLLVGETGVWTRLSGDAILVDTNDPTTQVTSLSIGLNEFSWEVTEATGTCTVQDIIQVNFIPVTIASAGTDQNICSNNTTLQANLPQIGETGQWNIVQGTGTFGDPTNPLTNVSNITSNTIEIEWTITDASGLCTSRDNVEIVSNLPIGTLPITVSIAIGDSLAIDVQGSTSINLGDVLTTSLSSTPQKGTATVLPDGTILYKPSVGFFGNDPITFEICNQCGNCSSNILTIIIPNNAPTFDVQDSVVLDQGKVTIAINLADLVSDINNNADLNTLRIIGSTLSGAIAIIDANYILLIDYGGITYFGTDEITLEVCDTEGVCTQSTLSFDVDVSTDVPPPITVYNAVTPNNDGKHDFLKIENISAYPNNEVFIYNRIGQLVFKTANYSNLINYFDGNSNHGSFNKLPNGTYYYVLNIDNSKNISGYFVLLNQ